MTPLKRVPGGHVTLPILGKVFTFEPFKVVLQTLSLRVGRAQLSVIESQVAPPHVTCCTTAPRGQLVVAVPKDETVVEFVTEVGSGSIVTLVVELAARKDATTDLETHGPGVGVQAKPTTG